MIETEIMQSLRKSNQKMRDIMTENISETNLSFRLFHILINIREYPDTNQKDLAKKLKLTQGALSGSLKRLLELDMLQRVRLEEDNRYNQLQVTQKGKEVLIEYEQYLEERLKVIFRDFSDEEMKDFKNLLMKLNCNLDEIQKMIRKDD